MIHFLIVAFLALASSAAFGALSPQGQSPGVEAGYVLAIDFNEPSPVACGMVPVTTVQNVPLIDTLDISTVFALQSNTSLGFAASRGVPIGDRLKFHVGIHVRSIQSPGSDHVRLRGGIILGASLRL